tara:strand:- start:1734 stop:2684 length:951 start_codon:yes stop_codon:yes gene_type:complete
MAHQQILSGIDFDPASDLTFTKAKINANGRKQVGILNSKSKKGVHLATPLMLTWGINEYVDDKTGVKSYDMALQFPNDEYNNPECVSFLKNMQALEQRIKNDAITNCKDWLNKTKTSADAIDALWTPMLRYPKDKETGDFDYSRAPTLKVKINYWEGEYKLTEIYDDNSVALFPNDNSIVPSELITKGSHVATILSCGGIWVANGKFGVTWRLFQAVVKPRVTLSGKCHISLSTKDKETMSAGATNQQEVDEEDREDELVVEQLASTTVADSDDEAYAAESAREAVVEAVKEEVKAVITEDAPKKKRIVKKAKTSE